MKKRWAVLLVTVLCFLCTGAVADCAHPETGVRCYRKDYGYRQIGDGKKHLACCNRYEYTECMACGQVLSEAEYARTETWYESHIWLESGVCDACRQENACAHGETCSWIEEQSERFEQIGDGEKHRALNDRYAVTGCVLCGLRLSEEYVDMRTRNEDHFWEDGICWGCGQENTCTHESATHTEEELWDWRAVSCIDDKTHKLNGQKGILTYCDLCHTMISLERLDWQWITEEHSMDGDRCWYCEYTIDCEHDHMITRQLSQLAYCEAVSDTVHAATYCLFLYDYCEDCGTLFDHTAIPAGNETIEEPHRFTDLGICVDCGYSNN